MTWIAKLVLLAGSVMAILFVLAWLRVERARVPVHGTAAPSRPPRAP